VNFKALIAVFFIIMFFAAYVIGGSESVSKGIEKYTEEKLKTDPEKKEKMEFFNIQYCDFTAKYDRALELLEKYLAQYPKEQYQERAIFQKAKTLEHALKPKEARPVYQQYIEDFPEGKNIENAKERFQDLKTFF
jgi:outer membrane protein assembly factor BamD (BamD/ComL family)